MIILKYIVTFVLSIISVYFFSMVLIVLRCGIPFCNECKKEPDIQELEIQAIELTLKKYYLALFIDTIIVIILFSIVYFLIKECLIFYIVFSLFSILISITKTGMTKDNISEVLTSIKAYKEIIQSKNDNS